VWRFDVEDTYIAPSTGNGCARLTARQARACFFFGGVLEGMYFIPGTDVDFREASAWNFVVCCCYCELLRVGMCAFGY
jgi:hypothetical protein